MRLISSSKRSKEESHVALINDLIHKSFGSRYNGDYDLVCVGGLGECGPDLGFRDNGGERLANICRTFLCLTQGPFGRFTKKDGSALQVAGTRYEGKARGYARLYEQEFGRKVAIELLSEEELWRKTFNNRL